MEQEKQRGPRHFTSPKRSSGWNIHFGSMLIGFLLALCLVLALGAAAGGDWQGQYRCSAGSDTSVFVIDTRTSQTWQLSRSDNIDFGTPLDRRSLRKSITPMLD